MVKCLGGRFDRGENIAGKCHEQIAIVGYNDVPVIGLVKCSRAHLGDRVIEIMIFERSGTYE